MPMLKIGQRLNTREGTMVQVERFLAAGGQGEVYEVTSAGRHYALKWYFYPTTAEQTTQLEEMKNAFSLEGPFSKAPPDSRFLWPITMVNDPRNKTFGYLIPLLPREYQGLERLVLEKCVQSPILRPV